MESDEPRPWTPEEQIAALARLERMEGIISAIFEKAGCGPVRFTTVDWNPTDEAQDRG